MPSLLSSHYKNNNNKNSNGKGLNHVFSRLHYFSVKYEFLYQWISAYYGLSGNETAGSLAKPRAYEEQPDKSIQSIGKKFKLKTYHKNRWEAEYPNCDPSDPYNELSKIDQTIVTNRLRTNEIGLRTTCSKVSKLVI